MNVAIALFSGTLLFGGIAYATTNDTQTAGQFLQQCRLDQAWCQAYLKGAIDGTVWTQIFDHDQRLCFPHGESYLEIIDAYQGYLATLAGDPHAWLSKDNMFILEDFLTSRYGCPAR